MSRRLVDPPVKNRRVDGSDADQPAKHGRVRARWFWPVLVVAVTSAYAAIPYVVNPFFFQRGDTAAQFAPTWYHLGEMVRDGTWPPVIDVGAWQGGNYAAEALFGVYNPLNVLIWVSVSLASDLMVATFLVKATVLVLLALGTYFLAREYRCAPWAAAVVATALPFSGFTLYWDAGSWPSGLIAFAYTPWVWLFFRRCLRGASNPLWAFLVGVLAVTQGNPYGTLALVVVGGALLVEGFVRRQWGGVVKVVLAGACVAAFLPLVYLPLLETTSLAVRSGGPLFENNGKLRPELGDLFGLSSPTYVPGVRAITGPMQVPATYLMWLIVPLLPWFRYGVLRRRWRELIALGLVTFCYLALAVGPSKMWLFRWPLRVVEYGYLGLALVVGILLTQGLQRTHVRARVAGTAALVLVMGYQTWAQHPAALQRAAVGMALVAGGAALVLSWHLLRPGAVRVIAVLCIAVTGVVLLAQSIIFGENASSRLWHVPSDVSAIQAGFADLDGRTMQFADLKPLQNRGQVERLERAWDDYLPGSMYQVAGVDAVNNYTGMGYRDFGRTFCMEYDGLTKQCGYRAVWGPTEVDGESLADLMKLETIVVQPELMEGIDTGPGWSEQSRERERVVLVRDDEVPWPDSRLSFASEGIDVSEAATVTDTHEQVTLSSGAEGGRLVFAMIAWPGWSATLDGHELRVGSTNAGLLTVQVPADSSGTVDVTFSVPRQQTGLASAALGTLGALLLGGFSWWWDRRRGRPTVGT